MHACAYKRLRLGPHHRNKDKIGTYWPKSGAQRMHSHKLTQIQRLGAMNHAMVTAYAVWRPIL